MASTPDNTLCEKASTESTEMTANIETNHVLSSRVLDLFDVPMFGIDTSGRINLANRKFSDILGISCQDLLESSSVQVIHLNFSALYKQAHILAIQDFIAPEHLADFNSAVLNMRHSNHIEGMKFALVSANSSKTLLGFKGCVQSSSADIVFLGVSEREENSKNELRSLDKQPKDFLSTANNPIFSINSHGVIEDWNDTLVSLTGLSRDDVVGKNLIQVPTIRTFRCLIKVPNRDDAQDIVPKENQTGAGQKVDQALRGIGCDSLEFPLFTADSRRIDLLFSTTPRISVRGAVIGVTAIGLDITERKQIEVEKTRVAQELQTFIDTTNAPIFGIDANGLVNEWNEKSVSITGYARGEVLGRNLVRDFITQEYQLSVQGVIDDALQGREAANFEFPFYTKDNRRVEVLLNATTRRDFGGNVVGVLCIGQDITERKQVEVEKTRVAQELQTFIDTANAPIFGIDADGLVNEWNNKSAAITGFSREEVLGKNLVQVFITQEYQVSVKEVLDNALHGRETANFEFPLYTRDQRRVEVLLNATTRRDVSGNVVGVLGVGQDITERKQIEVEKTRVAQELQTFIDTANAPIFGIDANGLVNEWNNKSAAITGFSREEVLGRNLVQVSACPICILRPMNVERATLCSSGFHHNGVPSECQGGAR